MTLSDDATPAGRPALGDFSGRCGCASARSADASPGSGSLRRAALAPGFRSRSAVAPRGSPGGRARTAIVALGLALFVLASAASPVAAEPWFPDLTTHLTLAPEDAEAVARHIADSVFRPEAPATPLPAAAAADGAPRMIFLSVSDGMSRARIAWVTGAGVPAAAARAVERVRAFEGTGSPVRWLKIDFVRETVALPPPAADGSLALEPGLDGLAFDAESGIAFLPDEVVARALVDAKARLHPNAFANYLARRFPRAGAFDPRQPGRAAWRFTTASFFCDGRQVIPLAYGHRTFEDLAPSTLLSSAAAGLRYLTSAIDGEGKFVYLYRPRTNSPVEDYNILRHSGTIMAMLEVVEAGGDRAALGAIERAVRYLLGRIVPAPASIPDAACLEEGGLIKLGGAGLGTVALCKWVAVTGDRAPLDTAMRLGRYIESQQIPGGEFAVHTRTHPGFEPDSFRSEYYPGEALLGLMRLHALAPEAGPWAATAEKGARWLIGVRDAGKTIETLEHDHWLLYALNELHRARPRPEFLEHARKIVEAILSRQHRRPARADWRGGYYHPPRSTPVATRSEGLWAAWQLFRDFGAPGETAPILEALDLGVRFQLQTQFHPERAMYFDDPQRCLGAFHHDLETFDVRIDYVQHNLSAILGLWRASGGGK